LIMARLIYALIITLFAGALYAQDFAIPGQRMPGPDDGFLQSSRPIRTVPLIQKIASGTTTYTFTKPYNVAQIVVISDGGRGGNAGSASGGGGGGGSVADVFYNLRVGEIVTFSWNTGTNSTFTFRGCTYTSNSGVDGGATAGGLGGSPTTKPVCASANFVSFSGGNGQAGDGVTQAGAGAGSAGILANGNNGASSPGGDGGGGGINEAANIGGLGGGGYSMPGAGSGNQLQNTNIFGAKPGVPGGGVNGSDGGQCGGGGGGNSPGGTRGQAGVGCGWLSLSSITPANDNAIVSQKVA
jgi:hypothetical protein